MTGRLQSSCIEIVPSIVPSVFITDVLKVDVAGMNFKKIFQQILSLFQTSHSNLNKELLSSCSQGEEISVYKFMKN